MTTDPFSATLDVLLQSAVGETVDYERAAGGGAFGIRALSSRIDVEGGFGDVRISHDVRRFEIRVADLAALAADPTRGDRIVTADGAGFRVQTIPMKDELGLSWVIQAYKE